MKKMLFVCVVIAMLLGVTSVKADALPLFTLDANEYQIFAEKYNLVTNGRWISNGQDRPFEFEAWNLDKDGERFNFTKGTLNFVPVGDDQIKPDVYPTTKIGFKHEEAFVFSFDNEQFLSAFTFDLLRQDATGQLFTFKISYQFWYANDDGDWVLSDPTTLTRALDNVPGDATIFFGIEAPEDMYLANFSVMRLDPHNGMDHFKLTISGVYGGPDVVVIKDKDPDPDPDPNSTPEPATLLILGLATIGAGFAARRRTR